ncbi:signal recognition particle, SRP9/SRP14 subunit [Lentinula raphanica]|nr:signal recognition particle, SRP9/SRP14 subunit [Lentinula raphanica]
MQLVDHDTFFKRLTALFDSSKNQGSIWITHKRLSHDDADVEMKVQDGAEDSRSYSCLMRVSDGDKVKFSTTVNSTELPQFHQVYGALLKSSMTTLRKRDKKREKQRAEDAAARKKRLSEPVIVAGPKRGNGRRKRQRRIKAALKQQEALAKIKSKEDAKAKTKLTTGAPCQFTISSQFKHRGDFIAFNVNSRIWKPEYRRFYYSRLWILKEFDHPLATSWQPPNAGDWQPPYVLETERTVDFVHTADGKFERV